MATVVSVAKSELNKRGIADFTAWASDPTHVYVGRFTWPTRCSSKWQNPFTIKKYGLEKCLELYEKYVRETPELWDSLD